MAERIIRQNVTQSIEEYMIKYAIAVNRRRAIPERKDGLKLIHRRILDAMYYNEPCETSLVKSVAITGDVTKKSHPHGDVAIYEAMKPMTNWFEIKMPLLKGKGNWGNFQGDGAAASRYTETKLSKFTIDCFFNDLKQSKQVIDWDQTFDGRAVEPRYLPVAVPLLLINGAFGIGYGMSVAIPKHNLNEVLDATINLIRNPNSDVVLAPDLCMKCEIIDTNWKAISNKGHGKFIARGLIDVENISIKEYKNRQVLIIKSVPDLVFLNTITDTILKLIDDKKIIQIQDMIDDSNEDNMRYIIVLKKGADANFVKELIYKHTKLQTSINVNFEVVDGLDTVRMSYKAYLQSFIEFRKITKFRLYCNKLQHVETEIHKREAFIKAIQSGKIDDIDRYIRKQTIIDDNASIEYLIKTLNITDLQAQFILDISFKKLSIGYLNKYIEEVNTYKIQLDECMNKIYNEDALTDEIIQELLEFKRKYGTPRQCKIVKKADVDGIPSGEFKLVITENNFIKKLQLTDSINTFKGDSPKHIIKVDNAESILIYDSLGKVFKLNVHKIPFTDRNSAGIDIRMLVKGLTANILTVMYEPTVIDMCNKTIKHFLIVLTEKNYIKRLDLDDLRNVAPSGLIYTKLADRDKVVAVNIIAQNQDIIIYTKNKALRFNSEEVSVLKRNTVGTFAMKTDEDLEGLSVIYHNTTDIIVVTNNARINRFSALALPTSNRYKAGSTVIKLSKEDSIFNIFGVNENNVLRIVTKNEISEFPVADIPVSSSVSAGNKALNTKGDTILKCSVFLKK